MPYRYVQLVAHRDIVADAVATLEDIDPREGRRGTAADDGVMESVHLVVHASRSQAVMDAIADALGPSGRPWRLSVIAAEAVLPEPESEEEQEHLEQREQSTAREEIFTTVKQDAHLTRDRPAGRESDPPGRRGRRTRGARP